MNPTIAVMTLRALSLLLNLQGQPKLGNGLATLANGLESGADVDAHMKAVAEALKSGQQADFNDVAERISLDSARLQGG